MTLFVGYQDDPSSEDYFEDLIDTVLNNFAEERTLGGWNSLAPLSLDQLTRQDYINQTMLAHRADFSITIIDDQDGLAPH